MIGTSTGAMRRCCLAVGIALALSLFTALLPRPLRATDHTVYFPGDRHVGLIWV